MQESMIREVGLDRARYFVLDICIDENGKWGMRWWEPGPPKQ